MARVSESTKHDQVMGNIQKNAQTLKTIQTALGTGKKITKTSDDPIGATIAQDIVTTISRQEQTKQNIDDNLTWLERNEVELEHMAEILVKAKTLILSQAGSSASPETRHITAQELKSIREALIDAGNARSGKLYMFSGTKTFTPALQPNPPIQSAKVFVENVVQKDVRELLDVTQFKAQFEGYSPNSYRIRVTETGPFGQARYQISDDDGFTWSKDAVMRPTIPIYNPEGKPNDKVMLKFADEQGLLSNLLPDLFNFNEAAPDLFDIGEDGIIFPEGLEFVYQSNSPIGYTGNRDPREVIIAEGISVPLNITAEDVLLGGAKQDGVNIFAVLDALDRSLEGDDGTTLANRLGDLDKGVDQILKYRAEIGNRTRELEKARDKVDDQVFSKQKRLSEIRDIDVAETMVDLNTAEMNNRTALDAGARLIQPTLVDFLR